MEPVKFWALPEKERNAIFKAELYAQFMALPEEEREAIYYKSFLKSISSYDSVLQEELKEEYKEVYAGMLEKRAWIEEQQRIHQEKYPNGPSCSYANYYNSGRFTVFWADKYLEYNA